MISGGKVKLMRALIVVLISFLLIGPAWAVTSMNDVIDCRFTDMTDAQGRIKKDVASDNMINAKVNMHYLMEGIYFGVSHVRIGNFIRNESYTPGDIANLNVDVIQFSSRLNQAAEDLEALGEQLSDDRRNASTRAILDYIKRLKDYTDDLSKKIDDQQTNLKTLVTLKEVFIDCLESTKRAIEKQKNIEKRRFKQIKDEAERKICEDGIRDLDGAARNVDDSIQYINAKFKQAESFVDPARQLLIRVKGVTDMFYTKVSYINTSLVNITDPLESIERRAITVNTRELIEILSPTFKAIEQTGQALTGYLQSDKVAIGYTPRFLEGNFQSYNDLTESIQKMLEQLNSIYIALDKLNRSIYTVRAQGTTVHIVKKIKYEDEFAAEQVINKGEYKIIEMNDDGSEVIIEDDAGEEYTVPGDDFYKAVDKKQR